MLTVHDLIPLLRPAAVSKALALQMRFLLPRALRRADRIVCVSHWTRATVAELFPEAGEKCVIIPNGRLALGPDKPPKAGDAIAALSVGRGEPYKRLPFLVSLLRQTKLPLTLTVVTDPASAAALGRDAGDLVSAGRLRLRSRLPTPELQRLYGEADVYLQPSELEGYCLPAADALSALTPVVYQKGSGIDEVAGTAVGWGLAAGSGVKAWEEAVEAAARAGRSAGFRAEVEAHLARLPTWSAVAAMVAALYQGLIN